jgi:hypothetical protein
MNEDIRNMSDKDLMKTALTGMDAEGLAAEIGFLRRGLPEGGMLTLDDLRRAGASEKEAERLFWMFALAQRARGERKAFDEIQ